MKTEEIEVYEAVKPLVENVIEKEGGSAALFMFGQTGSGKTHTMSNIELNTFKSLCIWKRRGEGMRAIFRNTRQVFRFLMGKAKSF